MALLFNSSLKAGILCLICVVFSKCSLPLIEKEAPQVNEISNNSKFQIILPEDHTTGYIWQLNQDYDKQLIENVNVVWHGNEKGVYFNFKTLHKGQAVLTFTNRKYTDTSNVKSFIIKILE